MNSTEERSETRRVERGRTWSVVVVVLVLSLLVTGAGVALGTAGAADAADGEVSDVETLAPSDLDTTGPTLHGNVTLGDSNESEAWFEYREANTTGWSTTDSKTVTDSGEFSIVQPLDANTAYEIRAVVDDIEGDTLAVETGETVATEAAADAETVGPTMPGTVDDLGGLEQSRVWFEYRTAGEDQWRDSRLDPLDISADGDFHEAPDGYAHDGDYAHINEPILDGETLTVQYYEAGSGANFEPHLREEPYEADGSIDSIWSRSDRDVLPSGEISEVRLEHEDNEVDIYVNDDLEWTASGIHQDAVYFSAYEWAGSSGESSLRLLGTFETLDEPGGFDRALQVGEEFSPETAYEFRAVAERGTGEIQTFETGDPLETVGATDLETVGPSLQGGVDLGGLTEVGAWFEYREAGAEEWSETTPKRVTDSGVFAIPPPLDANTTYEFRAVSGTAGGNIVTAETGDTILTEAAVDTETVGPTLPGTVDDLGGLEQSRVWFEYREAGHDEWVDSRLDPLDISADGDFHEAPDGYAHDGDYAHVNAPILEGESLTLWYYEAGSGANFEPHLREEPYEADGSIDSIWSRSDRDVLSRHETAAVRLEHEGDEVDIYVNDDLEWTASGIHQDAVYFSAYEWAGSSGETSLRLLGTFERPDEPGTVERALQTGPELDTGTTYEFRAIGEGGVGEVRTFETGNPVETVGATGLDTAGPTLQGDVELGGVDEAQARFEYREMGTAEWQETDRKILSASGEFGIVQPLDANTTYEIRAVVDTVAGEVETVETGDTVTTGEATDTDTLGPTVHGEVDALGGLDRAETWFEFREAGLDDWRDTRLDVLDVSADGSFHADPDGYAHDGDYAHVNAPVEDGESMTLLYYEADSGANFEPHLREEPYEADGSIDSIWSRSDRDVLSPGEIAEVRLEHEDDEVDIYVNDDLEWTATGIDQRAVYFSAYEWAGSSGESSLRLLGAFDILEEPGPFEQPLQVGPHIEADTAYEFRAVTDGSAGETLTFEASDPVETLDPAALDAAGSMLRGHVDLGGVGEASAWFEFRESGASEWSSTVTRTVTESGNFTITQSLDANTTYEIRAVVDGTTGETITATTGDTIATGEATSLDTLGPTLHGLVDDLGGFDRVGVWFQYREAGTLDWTETFPVELDRLNVSADGDMQDDPPGYAHDNDYAHVNEPLPEGESVTLRYYEAGSGADFRPHLREEPHEADGSIDDIWSGSERNVLPSDDIAHVRVEHVEDRVHIYVEGDHEWTATGINQEAVYFSGYEWSGSSDETSLRLLGSFKRLDEPRGFDHALLLGTDVHADTDYEFRAVAEGGTGEIQSFELDDADPVETLEPTDLDAASPNLHGTVELGALDQAQAWFEFREADTAEWTETDSKTLTESGNFTITQTLDSNTTYEIRATVEGVTGETLTVETKDTVTTGGATETDTIGPTLHGALDNLGGREQISVWFQYREAGTLEWTETFPVELDRLNVSADGEFHNRPAGYAHDNDYAHSNEPLPEGESVTLRYYEAGSGADFRPHLREEPYEADGSIDDIWSGSERNVLSSGDISDVRLEHDDDEVHIYVDGSHEWTAEDVHQNEVYFSGYEWSGSSDETSLRLLGSIKRLDEPGEFEQPLRVGDELDPDTEYEFRAVAEEGTGDTLTLETADPVETLDATEAETAGPVLHGAVELGGLDTVSAWFEFREAGTDAWSESDDRALTDSGEFDIAQALNANTTYEFRAVVGGITGETLTVETGDTITTTGTADAETLAPTLQGSIDDLGGFDEAEVWFQYRETGDEWVDTVSPRHEPLNISADGAFHANPEGYAHDNDYAHINEPLPEGQSMTLLYYEAGSGADFRPHLREEPYEADGGIDDIWSGSERNVLASNDISEVRLEHEDDEVHISVDGDHEWTAEDIHEETVYFSGYEWSGSSDETSLRLLGRFDSLEEPGEFERTLRLDDHLESVEQDTDYEFRAIVEGGAGETLTVTTGEPVETVGVSEITSDEPVLHGAVELGALETATAWFEYRETGTSSWSETDHQTVTDSGEFTTAQSLDSDTEYEARAVVGGVTGDSITFETAEQAFFSVTLTDAPGEVPAGETFTVEYEITNTGEVTDTQDVHLEVDGTQEDTNPDTELDPGESVTDTFGHDIDDPGDYTVTVRSDDDTDNATVGVFEPDPAEFLVDITDTTGPIDAGDTLEVTAAVENVGQVSDSQTVELAVGDLGTNATAVELAAGESTDVTRSLDTDSEDAGEYTATVSTANDSASTDVTVLSRPFFAVDILETTEPAEGEPLAVTVDVHNTGDRSDLQTVALEVPDLGSDETQVELDGGESAEETLSVDTESGDVGEYNATASTANDTDTTAVEVARPATTFEVSVGDTNAPVVAGDTLQVSALVENVGEVAGTQTVELDVPGLGSSDAAVTLDAGDDTAELLTVETAAGDDGEYTATLSTANDTASTDVTVLAPPAFDVSILETNDPVAGDPLEVTVEIDNEGATAEQTIVLDVDGLGEDATEVALEAGESTTETLAVTTTSGDAGEYAAVVESDDDTDIADIEVVLPPEFVLNSVAFPDKIEPGDSLDVDYEVANIGEGEDTDAVELDLDETGGPDDSETLTLSGGENATGTLTYDSVDETFDEGETIVFDVCLASYGDCSVGLTDVVSDAPGFDVTGIETNAPLAETAPLEIAVDIENTAGQSDSQQVSLDAGPLGTDARSVDLDAGATTTATLSVGTVPGDVGEYDVDVATDDDVASTSVVVEPLPDDADFQVDIENVPDAIPPGATLFVPYTVSNEGEEATTQTVEFHVDGERHDDRAHTVSPNNTRVDLFAVETLVTDEEPITVTVTSEDDADTRTVELDEEADETPAEYNVSLGAASDPIGVGEPLVLEYTLENVGELPGQSELLLEVDGQLEATDEVAVGDGASETGSFLYYPETDDIGELDVALFAEGDEASATVNVTEEEQLEDDEFDISLEYFSVPVFEGETVYIAYSITNEGESPGVQELTLTVDGQQEHTEEVALTSGESVTSEVVRHDTELGDDPGITFELATEDDAVTRNVTVMPLGEYFDVTSVTTNNPFLDDEAFEVSATIKNRAVVEGTQTVDVEFDGLGERSTDLELDGKESTTITESFDIDQQGEYDITVTTENTTRSLTTAEASFDVDFGTGARTNAPFEGDDLEVTARITNEGTFGEQQPVDLEIPGLGSTGTELALRGGEQESVTLSVPTGPGDAGDYTATVSTDDDERSTAISDSLFETDISGTSTTGGELEVTATITSRGTFGDTQTVELDVEELGGDSAEVELGGQPEHSLVCCPSESVTLSVPVSEADTGTYTATVATEDDTGSTSVTVSEPQFDVMGVTTNGPFEGDDLVVSATIANQGTFEETQTVDLDVGTLGGDATSLTLDGQQSETVTLSVPTGSGDEGEYTATVSTDDDEASTGVTAATFSPSIVDIDNLHVGEQVELTATITNQGTFGGSQIVEMDAGGLGSDATSIALHGGDSTQVTFETLIDDIDDAPYEVTVATDDGDTSTTLADGPMNVSVWSTSVADQQLSVTAYVEQRGDFGDSQQLQLSVPGLGTDSTTVELDGGSWTLQTLSVGLEEGDDGEHTATVSTEDDAASTDVTVPTDFDVSMQVAVEPDEIGEQTVVLYSVTNDGPVPATQDIEFRVNGTLEDSNDDVSLGVDEIEEGSFTYTPDIDDMPVTELEVATDDDAASATLDFRSDYEIDLEYVTERARVGDEAVAVFNVTNNGTIVDSQDIEFAVDGSVEDSIEDVALAPDETETGLAFDYLITEEYLEEPPEFTVSTRTSEASERVGEVDSTLNLTIVGTNAPVVAGEDLTVDINVSNQADYTWESPLTMAVDGLGSSSIDVSVPPDTATIESVSFETDADDIGWYQAEAVFVDRTSVRTVRVVPELDANITVQDEKPVTGRSVPFLLDTPAVDIDEAHWSFGNSDTETAYHPDANVTATYDEPGDYDVEVTVELGTQTATATESITVEEAAENPVDVQLSRDVADSVVGEAVTFEGGVDAESVTGVDWFVDGDKQASYDSDEALFVHTFEEPGVATVTLEADTGQGNATVTENVPVSPDDGPTIDDGAVYPLYPHLLDADVDGVEGFEWSSLAPDENSLQNLYLVELETEQDIGNDVRFEIDGETVETYQEAEFASELIEPEALFADRDIENDLDTTLYATAFTDVSGLSVGQEELEVVATNANGSARATFSQAMHTTGSVLDAMQGDPTQDLESGTLETTRTVDREIGFDGPTVEVELLDLLSAEIEDILGVEVLGVEANYTNRFDMSASDWDVTFDGAATSDFVDIDFKSDAEMHASGPTDSTYEFEAVDVRLVFGIEDVFSADIPVADDITFGSDVAGTTQAQGMPESDARAEKVSFGVDVQLAMSGILELSGTLQREDIEFADGGVPVLLPADPQVSVWTDSAATISTTVSVPVAGFPVPVVQIDATPKLYLDVDDLSTEPAGGYAGVDGEIEIKDPYVGAIGFGGEVTQYVEEHLDVDSSTTLFGDAPRAPPSFDNSALPQPGDREYGGDGMGLTRGVGAGEAESTDQPVASGEQVTDREALDDDPSVAPLSDGAVAAWTSEREGESTPDVAVTTGDGAEWGEHTFLTEADDRAHLWPAVDADGSDVVVAWQMIDGDVTEMSPGEILDAGTVAYAHSADGGETWSAPTTVADTEGAVTDVTVAHAAGSEWAIAWEETPEAESERTVGHLLVDTSGGATEPTHVENASAPALAATGTGAHLVYTDDGAGTVDRVETVPGGTDPIASHPATSMTAVTATGSSTAWLSAETPGQAHYAADGAVETVDLGAGTASSLAVVETDAGTVLTYRTGDSAETVGYRLQSGGSWLSDRSVSVSPAEHDVGMLSYDVLPRGEGVALLAGAAHDGQRDLFGASHEFGPDYRLTVTATEADVLPGAETTVEYEVENVGDVDGENEVAVTVEGPGDTTTVHDPLARGDAVGGTATVPVGENGTVRAVAEAVDDEQQLQADNARETVRVASPDVTVQGVRATVESGTATVTTTLHNAGTLNATAVPVRLATATGPVANLTVDLPAGETATVETTVSPGAVESDEPGTVVVDPEAEVPEVERTARTTWFLQPDLRVAGNVTYGHDQQGLHAAVTVANEGQAATEATVELRSEAGHDLGSTTVTVAPGETLTNLRVPLSRWYGVGEPIQVTASAEGVDARPGQAVVRDEFGPILGGRFAPPPVVGDAPPQDLNGDGLFEDIDGDGTVDIFDTQALFDHLHSDSLEEYSEAFNFNQHDENEITIFDVATHWHEYVDND